MALFRQTGARGSVRRGDTARTTAPRGEKKPAHREPQTANRPLRFILWLLAGIAVMAGVGYIVAAVWLFPSPLLPSERVVPRVVGMTEREAVRQLERAGFTAHTVTAPHATLARGLVTWQDPPPGLVAPRNAAIQLTISAGAPMAVIPNVEGMDLALAGQLLAAVGLRVDGVDTLEVKGRTSGTTAGTLPAAGDSVPVGRGVIVHITQ